jgi:DNA polymerase III subunit delta'
MDSLNPSKYLLSAQIQGHQDILNRLCLDLKTKRLPSCLAFSGPAGIGKKLVAKALAQVANCEKPQDRGMACGNCGSCYRAFKNQSESVFELTPQGQSIRIDDARKAAEFFNLQNISPARFLIIDDADLLNVQAANSLLKTLEEPPSNSYIILVTSSLWKLLPTIKSRSVPIIFRPLNLSELKLLSPQAPLWALHSSYGQVGRIENLILWDKQGLRDKATIMLSLLESRSSVSLPSKDSKTFKENFFSSLSHKETSLNLLKCLQSLIRDLFLWRTTQSTDGLLNIDRLPWIQSFNLSFQGSVDDLATELQILEKKLYAHVEGSLAFESFILSITNKNPKKESGSK